MNINDFLNNCQCPYCTGEAYNIKPRLHLVVDNTRKPHDPNLGGLQIPADQSVDRPETVVPR